MKARIVVALAMAFLLLPADHSHAQSDRFPGGIFLAPNSARRVTVTHDAIVLASFTIPKGTFLSAFYDDPQPAVATGRWEFHGTVELRAAAVIAMTPSDITSNALPSSAQSFGPRIRQIINQAPFVLTLQGVNVVIENVEQ
ncbi:MAG: hypothetical protein LAO77_10990 [Acidobacteriia bacterium]|nr:hypothetical protein [Terriglobia bacterium]